MKKNLFLLPLLFAGVVATSQQGPSPLGKIYFSAGIGPATRNGFAGAISLHKLWKNNWTTTISYHQAAMNPKNLPQDYDEGYARFLWMGFPAQVAEVNMKLFSATAGKYISTGRHTWLVTEAGFSLVNGERMSFSRRSGVNGSSTGIRGSNYNIASRSDVTAGVLLRADFNWAVQPILAICPGIFANVNSIQSPFGFQMSVVVGRMRSDK